MPFCRLAARRTTRVQVGVLRRQPGDTLGDGGVLRGPVVAATGQDIDAAGIEPGMHSIAVHFDLMEPVGTVRRGLDEHRELGLDPDRQRAGRASHFLSLNQRGVRDNDH